MLSPMSEKYTLGKEEHILIHQVDEGILWPRGFSSECLPKHGLQVAGL